MAQITRIEAREGEIVDKLASRPRLEGKHLTDAVYCNVKAFGQARLSARGDPPKHDRATLLRFLIGLGMEHILSEGRISQIETITLDDDSVGTIDVFWKGRCIEIKASQISTRKDIGEMDHWLTQLGGYVARQVLPAGKSTGTGELWIVHLEGDHGKKFCPEHGVPDRQLRRKHDETGAQRLICPECLEQTGAIEFLAAGDRDMALRCHEIRWTRAELESLHSILTTRQADIEADIKNPAYQPLGKLPPIRHGYDFECLKCVVKDALGCPGRQPNAEQELEDSLLAAGKSIEEIQMEVLAQ